MKTVAVSLENNIYFYSIEGKLLEIVENAHQSILIFLLLIFIATLIYLVFSSNSSFVATASNSDTSVRIWKNPSKK